MISEGEGIFGSGAGVRKCVSPMPRTAGLVVHSQVAINAPDEGIDPLFAAF